MTMSSYICDGPSTAHRRWTWGGSCEYKGEFSMTTGIYVTSKTCIVFCMPNFSIDTQGFESSLMFAHTHLVNVVQRLTELGQVPWV